MEAKVTLIDSMTFDGVTSSGHHVILDAAPEVGGKNKGPRPMELLLVALGACTGMDVISILRKKRQPVTGYEIIVRGERAEEHPKVFTSIVVEHVVRGKGVSPEAVARAVDLSVDKYCPISAMLRPGTQLRNIYRVIEE